MFQWMADALKWFFEWMLGVLKDLVTPVLETILDLLPDALTDQLTLPARFWEIFSCADKWIPLTEAATMFGVYWGIHLAILMTRLVVRCIPFIGG